MTFHATNITIKVGSGRAIVDNASLELKEGEVVAIVGPNGAGKSSLLRAMSGDLSPTSGSVKLNERKLSHWSADQSAMQRAVLPQNPTLAFPFRVCDVVELGRYPHRGRSSPAEHRAAIEGAMVAGDVVDLALRDCRTLSGGELHRVHFARALAQVWMPLADGKTRYLLLDEPTAALDLSHQGRVLSRALAFAQDGGGVLTVLHDLNLAAAFADRVVVMHKGKIVADGKPEAVLTSELLKAVWDVEGTIVPGDETHPLSIVVRHETGRARATRPRVASLRAAE